MSISSLAFVESVAFICSFNLRNVNSLRIQNMVKYCCCCIASAAGNGYLNYRLRCQIQIQIMRSCELGVIAITPLTLKLNTRSLYPFSLFLSFSLSPWKMRKILTQDKWKALEIEPRYSLSCSKQANWRKSYCQKGIKKERRPLAV